MGKNYSKRFKDILSFSRDEAQRTGYKLIMPDHLFLGIIREGSSRAFKALSHFCNDITKIKKSVDEEIVNTDIDT